MTQLTVDCIPSELANRNQWITWRVVEGQKRPNCKWQDSGNWNQFSEVSHFERIGFVFTDADKLCGIDLDGCIRADGTYTEWSQEILQRFQGVAYAEVSPSGTGIKLWTQGRKASGAKCLHQFNVKGRKEQIECYDSGRWFAVTGKLVEGFERIADGQEAIDWLCEKYLVPEKQAQSNSDTRKSVVYKVASSGLMNRALGYIDRCNRPSEGARNSTAFRLAGHLFALVEHDGERLSQSDVLELVRKWNDTLSCPLGDQEVRQVVASAETKGTPRADKLPEVNRFTDQDTNVSNLVSQAEAVTQGPKADNRPAVDHLYDVPGFIRSVMDLSLETARYPNTTLAFCGALSLMSLLVGRRVTYRGLSPNIYLMALASSGSGKDQARKVNVHLLQEAGLGGCLGDSIASGEGLEESLFRSPQSLYQLDELDSLVRAMAGTKEARFESIAERLLRFYTSSNSTYYLRRKADDQEARYILHPHLVLYGTCTPQGFYDAISGTMLTNGLFARMLVIEADARGKRQIAKPAEADPSIMQEIEHWKQLGCEGGNLASRNPKVLELAEEDDARNELEQACDRYDAAYDRCRDKRDECGMTIWSRAGEQAARLAALYACSANALDPRVTLEV